MPEISHWAHDVVATLNQRHWRWFNEYFYNLHLLCPLLEQYARPSETIINPIPCLLSIVIYPLLDSASSTTTFQSYITAHHLQPQKGALPIKSHTSYPNITQAQWIYLTPHYLKMSNSPHSHPLLSPAFPQLALSPGQTALDGLITAKKRPNVV